jgi:hypothetical protein
MNKYYVTMTDRFMSGWGMAANAINKLIIECDTYEQAEQIERHALDRSEMKYVNIRATKPHYGVGYYESWKTYSDMGGSWVGK